MKKLMISIAISFYSYGYSQITVSEVGLLPDPTANNAVCEGKINQIPHLFSFGGIDTTKLYSGIHLNAYGYNINTNTSLTLPNLPDTLGKVAMGASNVKNMIYIIGGYHVYADGNELSSDKVHRFNPETQTYLTDGQPIPKATDDHVQAVWKDSLIYVISGWKDVSNIPDVQIYNPTEDEWMIGTSIPNTNAFKSFGASGTIIGDTIYYFGGSSSGGGFPIQNRLRKGIINPDNPTDINWSISIPDPDIFGYRMASTSVNNEIHWVGGSSTNYNYDGIAYNGSGGVNPNNRDLWITTQNDGTLNEITSTTQIPMDLRGIAKIEENVQYIAGGMLNNQAVSNKIFKLEWQTEPINITEVDKTPSILINQKTLTISNLIKGNIIIYNNRGQSVLDFHNYSETETIDLSHLENGIYFIRFSENKVFKFIL